jgi:hypothetical protein
MKLLILAVFCLMFSIANAVSAGTDLAESLSDSLGTNAMNTPGETFLALLASGAVWWWCLFNLIGGKDWATCQYDFNVSLFG